MVAQRGPLTSTTPVAGTVTGERIYILSSQSTIGDGYLFMFQIILYLCGVYNNIFQTQKYSKPIAEFPDRFHFFSTSFLHQAIE